MNDWANKTCSCSFDWHSGGLLADIARVDIGKDHKQLKLCAWGDITSNCKIFFLFFMILVNWPVNHFLCHSQRLQHFKKVLTVLKHPQTTDDRTHEHLSTQEVNERYLVDTRPLYVQSHCPKSHTHPAPVLSLPKLQSHRQSRFGLIILMIFQLTVRVNFYHEACYILHSRTRVRGIQTVS